MKSKFRWLCIILIGMMFMDLQIFVVDGARAEQSQMETPLGSKKFPSSLALT